jgi:hypothetical protein
MSWSVRSKCADRDIHVRVNWGLDHAHAANSAGLKLARRLELSRSVVYCNVVCSVSTMAHKPRSAGSAGSGIPVTLGRGLLIGVALWLAGCGSLASTASESPDCLEDGCFAADGSVDSPSVSHDASPRADAAPQVDTGVLGNALCGVGMCQPDGLEVSNSCKVLMDAGGLDGAIDGAISSIDGGRKGDGGSEADAAGANMGGSFGSSDPPSPSGGPDNPSPAACRVSWDTAGPLTACSAAGVGIQSDPCNTSADCAPGLTCVSSGANGLCLRYCCGDPESSCPAHTYCSAELSRDYSATHPNTPPENNKRVPVCVPDRHCQPLGDPSTDLNACASGLSCMIERADGTTGCEQVPASANKEGGSCPCAVGHVCSKSSNTCMKLCHVGHNEDCTSGVCLSASLPGDLGMCISPRDD